MFRRGVTIALLATLWAAVAYLSIQIVDNFGTGYSPAWDDGLGWIVNYACLAVWLGAVLAALGIGLWKQRRLGYALSVLAVAAASFAAYRYWAMLDALAGASLPPAADSSAPVESNVLPEIWPWPQHEARTQSTRDVNADGSAEILLIDNYRVVGSANERIVQLLILRPTSTGYELLLAQSVDEGSVNNWDVGCPEGPPRHLGYHSAMWVVNVDIDASAEVYVHQQTSHFPPDCWYDYFFDWQGSESVGYQPRATWLWLHALFPYSLALAFLGLDFLRKPVWLLVITIIYVSWAAWEVWIGSYSGMWLIAGLGYVGLVVAEIFRFYRIKPGY